MPPSETGPSADVLRWYTRARRVPQLVGKLPGSERGIPGGPYTLTQMAGAGVAFWAASRTTSLWSPWVEDPFHMLFEVPVQVAAAVAAAFLLRLIKPGGRDPLTASAALCRVWLAGTWGQTGGTPVKASRTVHVSGQPRLLLSPLGAPAGGDSTESVPLAPRPAALAATDSVESPRAPSSSPVRHPAVTGLQRLLTTTTPGAPDA